MVVLLEQQRRFDSTSPGAVVLKIPLLLRLDGMSSYVGWINDSESLKEARLFCWNIVESSVVVRFSREEIGRMSGNIIIFHSNIVTSPW